MCCCSEPTHSHPDALWELFSLSAAFSCTISLSLLQPLPCLPPPSPFISTHFLSSLYPSLPLLLFLPLSHISLRLFSPLPFFLPVFHSSNSPEHLHCNPLTISHTPRGGVQLVHYVSWAFLRLMENTQNALAFHHSTSKRNSQSRYCLRKGKFPPTSFSSQWFFRRTVSPWFSLFTLRFLFCGLFPYCRLPWRNHPYTDFKTFVWFLFLLFCKEKYSPHFIQWFELFQMCLWLFSGFIHQNLPKYCYKTIKVKTCPQRGKDNYTRLVWGILTGLLYKNPQAKPKSKSRRFTRMQKQP